MSARIAATAGAKVFCNKCIMGCSTLPFVCRVKTAEKELCRTGRRRKAFRERDSARRRFHFISSQPLVQQQRQLRSQFCAPRHPSAIFSAQTLLFIKSGLSSAEWECEWKTGTWTRCVCFRLVLATNKKWPVSFFPGIGREDTCYISARKVPCPTGKFFVIQIWWLGFQLSIDVL
jgi:hypothetical protein